MDSLSAPKSCTTFQTADHSTLNHNQCFQDPNKIACAHYQKWNTTIYLHKYLFENLSILAINIKLIRIKIGLRVWLFAEELGLIVCIQCPISIPNFWFKKRFSQPQELRNSVPQTSDLGKKNFPTPGTREWWLLKLVIGKRFSNSENSGIVSSENLWLGKDIPSW